MLLVTEVVDETKMPQQLKTMLGNGVAANNNFLRLVGKVFNLPVCDISKNDFADDMFIPADGIHINEAGEAIKAKVIFNKLLPLITSAPRAIK